MSYLLRNVMVVLAASVVAAAAMLAIILLTITTNGFGTLALASLGVGYMTCSCNGWLK